MRAAFLCLALIGASLAGHPARAAATFTPPQGCHLDLTVQLHGCQVENHYHCDADAPGDRRISMADGTGEFYISRIDSETRWIASVDLEQNIADALDADTSADNASFSTLLATGRDDYDFIMRSNNGDVRRYIGYDKLDGGSVTMNNVPLERTEFSMKIEDGDGNEIATRTGHQLISRAMRVFFADTETFRNSYGDVSEDTSTPVTFSFPGQPGFAAARPQYDCDTMTSSYSPTLTIPLFEEAL